MAGPMKLRNDLGLSTEQYSDWQGHPLDYSSGPAQADPNIRIYSFDLGKVREIVSSS